MKACCKLIEFLQKLQRIIIFFLQQEKYNQSCNQTFNSVFLSQMIISAPASRTLCHKLSFILHRLFLLQLKQHTHIHFKNLWQRLGQSHIFRRGSEVIKIMFRMIITLKCNGDRKALRQGDKILDYLNTGHIMKAE